MRAMFAQIAPTYDRLNHLLSLNVDRGWRRSVVRSLGPALSKPGSLALDLCCGTCDLTLELGRLTSTVGVDFCRPMLEIGFEKTRGARDAISLIEADALRVPVVDGKFDAVTIAFGLRNLEDYGEGLAEILRVLREGGVAAILEFSHPRIPVFRQAFHAYFNKVLPWIGRVVSRSQVAYRYLPASVEEFPDQEELASLMRSVGFCEVRYYNLFGGVAAVHLGVKPAGSVPQSKKMIS